VEKRDISLALTSVAVVCLAVLYVYGRSHGGTPLYQPSGARRTSLTDVLGAALLFSIVSLLIKIRSKIRK